MARMKHNEKLFLCQKIAERRTYAQIIICFKEEFGWQITSNQIHYIKERAPKWQPIIEEMRTAHDLSVSDLALSSKRNRLQMAQDAFDAAEEGTRVDRYDKDGNILTTTTTKNPAAMVAAVRHGHEEMEGKSVSHKHSGKVKGGEKIFIISHIPPPDPLPDDIEEDGEEHTD